MADSSREYKQKLNSTVENPQVESPSASLSAMDTVKKTNTVISRSTKSPSNQQLPTIFAITPTYARHTQRVDLTSLCHTLMHVREITWIVIEDSEKKTELVTNLLTKCNVTTVHLNVKTPPPPSKVSPGSQARGVEQRNAGLSWIRTHCSQVKCRGVVYLMDDDNKYDLKLFEEVSKYVTSCQASSMQILSFTEQLNC